MRIAFAFVALLTLLSPALARDLKISHQWPAEVDARDRATRVFVKELQARLPETSLQVFPQLSLKFKAEEQFAALQSGQVDLSVYPLPYAAKQVPAFSLAVLPALYPSLEAVRHLKNTKVADQLQAIAEANGVHILAWWWVPGGFVTTTRGITGPDSVKGLKLRGGDPLFDLMLQKAGAIPVELTSNEIYAALKDGRLDGALTSYETFVSTNIQEHAKHFTAGSPGIWMFATPLLISKSVWDNLSNAEKDAFEAAARVSETYFASTQVEAEAKFIKVFTAAGAKYHKFTHDEYLAWLQLAQQTAWKQYTTISPAARGMLMEVVEMVMFSIGTR